jgi:hypothetical protein
VALRLSFSILVSVSDIVFSFDVFSMIFLVIIPPSTVTA